MIITSKEAILAVCRELASEQGLQAVNMRTVAEKCNVSVGSIYNYFPSKTDLMTATVQDVWQSIFYREHMCNNTESFPDYVKEIFESVQNGAAKYPNFFTVHSLSFANAAKGKGRQAMSEYFIHIKNGFLTALQQDKNVKQTVFTEDFTHNDFVDFIFSNIITLLVHRETSCHTLLEIIRRTIYN